jgi:NifU-like protein involved in Fe-S cluster formation
MVCDLVRGRTFEQAKRLDVNDLLAVLGGLPEGKVYLADLAVAALKSGIRGQS